ncbi:hypothetical protein RIF29_20399 [Crotalaria pallida]|uniref:NAC domain-containing protein n=1 Tax=Crotalaria pallida TaxID=3830 RepID=A0AAN9F4F2_CROPI
MAHASPSTSSKTYKPRDEELIKDFLYNKVQGKPVPNCLSVIEYDLYGDQDPWEIWENFKESSYDGKDLYVFTTLKKKSLNGSRFGRIIGGGSWEAEDTGKKVLGERTKRQCIGIKKRFRYEKNKTEKKENGRFRKNEKLAKKRKREDKAITTTGEKRIVVLGLAANAVSTDNMSDFMEEQDIEEGTRNKLENEDVKTKSDSMEQDNDSMEQDNDDDSTSWWSDLFSLELRKDNQGNLIQVQEQDIHMLPNPYYKDFVNEWCYLNIHA